MVGIAAALLAGHLQRRGCRGDHARTLLDTLQHTAFDFFWNEANPANGLIKDRSTSWSPCQHRLGRIRSLRHLHRDRSRLGDAGGRAGPGPDHARDPLERPAGERSHRVHRLQGSLLPLPGHEHRRPGPGTASSRPSTPRSCSPGSSMPSSTSRAGSARRTGARARRFDLLPCRLGVHAQWRPGDPHGLEARNRILRIRQLDRLQRGDDPLHPRPRIAHVPRCRRPPGTPGPAATTGRRSTDRLRDLPAALRSPVLALLDRLPEHPGRLHARAGASLTSRTRGGRPWPQQAYCIANPFGWTGYGANVWGITASRRPARLPGSRRAAAAERRRHDHPDGGRRAHRPSRRRS